MKMKKSIQDFIKNYNLQDVLIDEIIPYLRLETYKKDELILNAHQPVKNLYFLMEGMVEISSMMLSGNKIFINNLKPLEIFGDLEYVNKQLPLFDVLAAEDSLCIVLPFPVVDKYLGTSHHFWKLMALEGNAKLLNTNKATILKGSYSLKAVLSNFIVKNDYEVTFNSLTDLALQFNVSYRNLSRVIKELSENGIILKERRKIVAIDKKKLEEYSADL